jgi:hypothetical protein
MKEVFASMCSGKAKARSASEPAEYPQPSIGEDARGLVVTLGMPSEFCTEGPRQNWNGGSLEWGKELSAPT